MLRGVRVRSEKRSSTGEYIGHYRNQIGSRSNFSPYCSFFEGNFFMPYFVYKVTTSPIKLLEKLTQFDNFKEASTHAKTLRGDLDPASNIQIKVIFAENELQAEDLLSQVREPEPKTGEDY
jgi:hypothetical protein